MPLSLYMCLANNCTTLYGFYQGDNLLAILCWQIYHCLPGDMNITEKTSELILEMG